MTPRLSGHSRRGGGLADEGPSTICQTLATSDGRIISAAASTGDKTMASRPIEMVGGRGR